MFMYNRLATKCNYIAFLLSNERNVVYQVLYQYKQDLFARLIIELHAFDWDNGKNHHTAH